MTGTIEERLARQRKAWEMYENGATIKEISQTIGVTRQAVGAWLRGSLPLLEKKNAVQVAKHKHILIAYENGHSMAAIGASLGISGERVRQILKQYDIVGAPRVSQQAEKLAEAQQRREQRVAKFWGLTWAEYKQICDTYGTSAYDTSPIHKYIQQRKNARHRKIAWKLTFAEWWRIWQDSGKWTKRGRGNGYCMARDGDVGPYAVGNVSILPTQQNASDARKNKAKKVY